MKATFIAFSCILLGAVACAPQGKKLSATGSTGLAPVASGPTAPATAAAVVSEKDKGQVVNIYKNGTLTVTLDSAQKDGYSWRLSEIPDPTVLKLVKEDFMPPTTAEGRGQEKWVFETVGPGDVEVKMWYGNLRETPVAGSNPNFDFIASVADEMKAPEKKAAKTSKKAPKKA
ncbi:MAG: protease inhibitor I42 family protein [Chthoniobacter sp.]|uniref:protease inhibitor I42 family protein n=1 Tax=Chthoniobacter sp. TaxID=2510640 RepID=UPI0032A95AF2